MRDILPLHPVIEDRAITTIEEEADVAATVDVEGEVREVTQKNAYQLQTQQPHRSNLPHLLPNPSIRQL